MPQPPEEHSATTNKQLQHELQRLQLRLAREQKAGSVRVHNLQRRNTAIEPAEEVEEEGSPPSICLFFLFFVVAIFSFLTKKTKDNIAIIL